MGRDGDGLGLGRLIRAIGKIVRSPPELGHGHRLWQLDDNNVQDYSTIVFLPTLLARSDCN